MFYNFLLKLYSLLDLNPETISTSKIALILLFLILWIGFMIFFAILILDDCNYENGRIKGVIVAFGLEVLLNCIGYYSNSKRYLFCIFNNECCR